MLSRQASLARYVADEHNFALQRRKVDGVLVDVECRELVERRAWRGRRTKPVQGFVVPRESKSLIGLPGEGDRKDTDSREGQQG